MLQLQFVEIAEGKTEKIVLENLSFQIIGHDGDIVPKITNGHISRKHCSIEYDKSTHSWIVVDGTTASNRTSRNGLYTANGFRVEGRITLARFGDTVYLLKLDKSQAYLEVIEEKGSEKAEGVARATAGLEIQLAAIEVKAEQASEKLEDVKAVVKDNQAGIAAVKQSSDVLAARLDLLKAMIESGVGTVEKIGTKPKVYLTGTAIAAIMGILLITVLTVYTRADDVINVILQHKGYHQVPIDKKP